VATQAEAPTNNLSLSARVPPAILVVDDESGVRLLACRILEEHGYRTLQAGDGSEALEVLARAPESVAMVLTDIRMPTVGGLELERMMRARWPGIPVMLMSGETTQEWLTQVIRDRALHMLRKPFTAEILVEAVRELLEHRDELGA
jgi:two-component system, cell cycle sensor histidine kinase and response regulator CckA